MSDKLKPCPFCGAEPMYYKSFTKVTIGCRSADCSVNPTFSIGKREHPEAKWNSRIDDRMVEEIAELKGMLQKTATAIYSYNNEMVGMHAVINCASESVELLAKLNQEGVVTETPEEKEALDRIQKQAEFNNAGEG